MMTYDQIKEAYAAYLRTREVKDYMEVTTGKEDPNRERTDKAKNSRNQPDAGGRC